MNRTKMAASGFSRKGSDPFFKHVLIRNGKTFCRNRITCLPTKRTPPHDLSSGSTLAQRTVRCVMSTRSSPTGVSRRFGFLNGLTSGNSNREKHSRRFTTSTRQVRPRVPRRACLGRALKSPPRVVLASWLETPASATQDAGSHRRRVGCRMMESIDRPTFFPGMGTPKCRVCRRSLRPLATLLICAGRGTTLIRTIRSLSRTW